jgi:hypothetical protein
MGVQQRRKNPLPVVRAVHGHGIFLLEHGEPHDPCPWRAVRGNCGSRIGEVSRMWSAVCSRSSTAGRHPGAKMTPGGGIPTSEAPIPAR